MDFLLFSVTLVANTMNDRLIPERFSVALAANTMEDRLSPESYADSTTEENTLLKNDSTLSNPSSTYLPPCRICHRKASGFHYGVNTCEACKVCFPIFLDTFWVIP